MKKLSKNLISLAIISFLVLPIFSLPALAYSTYDLNNYGATASSVNVNLSGNVDPRTGATRIINLALTFLGLIALVIILIGGFKWMTAGGNEDKVGEAKKMIGAGVIGLVIVLAAWGISVWIINTIGTTIVQ